MLRVLVWRDGFTDFLCGDMCMLRWCVWANTDVVKIGVW